MIENKFDINKFKPFKTSSGLDGDLVFFIDKHEIEERLLSSISTYEIIQQKEFGVIRITIKKIK